MIENSANATIVALARSSSIRALVNAFKLLHAFRIHEEKFLGLIVVRKSDFRASEKMRRRLFGNQSIGTGRNRRRIGVGAVKGNSVAVGGADVVHIPEFIAKVKEGDFEAAYQIINQTSSLPAVCGRVCPQESQCEKYCTLAKKFEAVGIGRLERFVADWHNAHAGEKAQAPAPNGHKVAIVGSGPSGLTCRRL